ncbi:hypothetical protein DES34_103218 [Brevibacillus brevis]|nr:hypothetical protein DES34_103218 [Brevibacillus brevis]
MRRTLYPFLSIRALCKRGNAHHPRHGLLFKQYFQYCCCQNKVLRLIIARHLGGVNENKKILLDFRPNECSVRNGYTARFLLESGYNKTVKTVLLTASGRYTFMKNVETFFTENWKACPVFATEKERHCRPSPPFRFRFIAGISILLSKSLRLPDE